MSFPAHSHNVNVQTKQNKTKQKPTLIVIWTPSQPPLSSLIGIQDVSYLFPLLLKISYLCSKKMCHGGHMW